MEKVYWVVLKASRDSGVMVTVVISAAVDLRVSVREPSSMAKGERLTISLVEKAKVAVGAPVGGM